MMLTYWIMAKISPAVRPLPRSMRTPPRYTISRAAVFSTKAAAGSMISMLTLARIRLSAMMRVASVIFSWA